MKLRSSRRIGWFYQLVGITLLPLQLFAGTPLSLSLVVSAEAGQVHAFVPPPPPKVKVNRGPRDAGLITPALNLPADPSDAEITMARVFPEPLYPTGTSTDTSENQALSSALHQYYKSRNISSLTNFVTQHPQSRWVGSLDYNLGVIHYQTGYLSLALKDWQASWDLLKAATERELHALADRAFGELVVLNGELGRTGELKKFFEETKGRGFIGTGAERVQAAKEGYQIMKTHPTVAFKCGPFALDSIRTAGKNRHPRSKMVEGATSTTKGTSLAQVKTWSEKLGMDYQMAKRSNGASLIVPSVMHWKLGHFAALVREKKGKYLIQDPTFAGAEFWVTADALEAETSGYFLVPAGPLPNGWTTVSKDEAAQVWERGGALARDQDDTGKKACKDCLGNTVDGPNDASAGGKVAMTVASVFSMLATTHLEDTPVGYQVPVGPQVQLTVGYNYQEAHQPSNLPFSNFGNDWVFEYTSYLSVDASQNVTITLRGGGTETYDYSSFDNVNNVFAPDIESHAQLYQTGPASYERRMPDGSKDVYSQPDGTGRIFLKQIFDPQRNSLILGYDGNFRLTYVQDQLGQKTTFNYLTNTAGAAGFYKIQTITDPFGRSAHFAYDAANIQLIQITDAQGNVSAYTYDSNYFIDSLTTPYGKTLFYQYTPAGDTTARGLRVTLPDGNVSITENWIGHELNSYHWTRKQSPFYPDKTKAETTHWLQEAVSNVESGVISYTKEPLEGGPTPGTPVATGPSGTEAPPGSVVLGYPDSYSVTPVVGTIDPVTGQPVPAGDAVAHNYVGTSNQPNSVSRILDDGTTQTYLFSSNSFGQITSAVDPRGRTVRLFYDGNNTDLLEVRAASNDLLAKYTYNSQHEPVTYINGSGRKTTATYNGLGQITTITDAKGGVTTYTYDSSGYLLNIDGPLAGSHDKTTLAYDGYGRIYTISDSEGYTLTLGYDNLDRITSVAYPDGSFEQVIWQRLDPVFLRDRLGHWTQQQFSPLRQLAQAIDPDGHRTQYQWCTCGALGSMTDPAGHVTSWTRDLQGRATQKTYADGLATTYTFENNTSRLKTVNDARGQTKTYTYFDDDSLKKIAYSGLTTSTVNILYDTNYLRMTSVANGWGTVGYEYNAYVTDPYGTPTTGAGRVQKITNSVLGSSADVTCSYDELGRMTNRSINGSANSSTVAYDAMGRVTGITNPLGAFGYNYVDDANALGSGNDKGAGRLASMTYPNGQVTNYSYYGNTGDQRLKTISNLDSSSAVISKFDYGYDALGQITYWKSQIDSNPATRLDTAYDPAGQLLSAVKKTDSTNAVLKQYYYSYDSAGNRTSEQVDGAVSKTTVNSVNQITSEGGGGATRFQGAVSEPSTVKVNGQQATMTTSTNFVANPVLATGTNTVSVVAMDGSGNAQTNNYQVVVPPGSTVSPTYDLAGNMLTNGNGQTYTWDAENRLLTITYANGASTLFTYDGLGRRVQIVEKDSSGAVISTKQHLWVGAGIVEERDASNTVTKRFYSQGEQIAGTGYYYTRDHLGSVREMTDNSGTIQARYEYDPYGRVTPVGTIAVASDKQYAGMYEHAASGLNITLFRVYDSSTGRWLSRDPLGEGADSTLYSYVGNNPINKKDILGLFETPPETLGELKVMLDTAFATNDTASIEGLGESVANYIAKNSNRMSKAVDALTKFANKIDSQCPQQKIDFLKTALGRFAKFYDKEGFTMQQVDLQGGGIALVGGGPAGGTVTAMIVGPDGAVISGPAAELLNNLGSGAVFLTQQAVKALTH